MVGEEEPAGSSSGGGGVHSETGLGPGSGSWNGVHILEAN